VFEEMVASDAPPRRSRARGFTQVSDEGATRRRIDGVLAAHPDRSPIFRAVKVTI